MSPLTVLVFILSLGSLNCLEFGNTNLDTREHCKKQEGVGNKDLRDLNDMNIKCYYHCKFEKEGIITNGIYVGNHRWCQNVKDDNKCELARKVVICSMLRSGFVNI